MKSTTMRYRHSTYTSFNRHVKMFFLFKTCTSCCPAIYAHFSIVNTKKKKKETVSEEENLKIILRFHRPLVSRHKTATSNRRKYCVCVSVQNKFHF